MSEKTVRKYRDADQLPSQIERPERSYRTRPDPLAEYWRKNRDTLSLIPLESELATANVGECNSWSRNSEGESAAVTGESVEIDVVSAQL